MSIRLPGDLSGLLHELGYSWPESDEDQLISLGEDWARLAQTLDDLQTEVGGVARQVAGEHAAQAIDSFAAAWQADDGGAATLSRGSAGARAIGGGLTVCAGLVLALKINVLVQLTVLAAQIIQALVTAAATFGASLLEIPLFKQLTNAAIDLLVSQAMEGILD